MSIHYCLQALFFCSPLYLQGSFRGSCAFTNCSEGRSPNVGVVGNRIAIGIVTGGVAFGVDSVPSEQTFENRSSILAN